MVDGKYLDWVKLSAKHAFVVFVASSILIFAPEELVKVLSLEKVKELSEPWVGIIWIISLAITISESAIKIITATNKWVIVWKKKRARLKYLADLSPQEKDFLAYYVTNNTKTQSAPFNNGLDSSHKCNF